MRVGCAVREACRKGKVQGQFPSQEYGVSSSPPDIQEPGVAAAQFYLRKRTESRAVLGYGLPRSAPWDGLLREETFKYGPGRLPSPDGQGRDSRGPW